MANKTGIIVVDKVKYSVFVFDGAKIDRVSSGSRRSIQRLNSPMIDRAVSLAAACVTSMSEEQYAGFIESVVNKELTGSLSGVHDFVIYSGLKNMAGIRRWIDDYHPDKHLIFAVSKKKVHIWLSHGRCVMRVVQTILDSRIRIREESTQSMYNSRNSDMS
jgi:hypothetical protein